MNNNLTIKQIKLVFWRQDEPFEVVDLVPSCIRKCNYIHVRLPSFELPRHQRRKYALQFINGHRGNGNILLELYKIRRLNLNFRLLYIATFVECMIILNMSVSRTLRLFCLLFAVCCNKQFTS